MTCEASSLLAQNYFSLISYGLEEPAQDLEASPCQLHHFTSTPLPTLLSINHVGSPGGSTVATTFRDDLMLVRSINALDLPPSLVSTPQEAKVPEPCQHVREIMRGH